MKNLVIYLKPTDYCNVGCKHCYLTYQDRKKTKILTVEEVNKIIANLEKYYKNLNYKEKPEIEILWHGGEPLLIDYKDMKAMLESFEKSEIINFSHLIQTSLYPLFDLEYEDRLNWYNLFINHFNYFVGSSYDFGKSRVYKGSPEKYIQKLNEISVEMKKLDIEVSLSMTVNKFMIGKHEEIFNFLEENNKYYYSYQFERYNDYSFSKNNNRNKLDKFYISNREFSTFMINLQNLYVDKNIEDLSIQIIDSAFNMLKDGMGRDKWSGNCMTNFIIINPDGSTNNCTDKAHEESFGNIIEEDFAEILRNKSRIGWIKHQNLKHYNNNCLTCEFKKVCHSGCPLINNEQIDDECSGYKNFIKNTQIILENNNIKHVIFSPRNQIDL